MQRSLLIGIGTGATPAERAEVARLLSAAGVGYAPALSPEALAASEPPVGALALPDAAALDGATRRALAALPAVARLTESVAPFPLASRDAHPSGQGKTRVQVGDAQIGGDDAVIIAGPCSVESEEQIVEAALRAREAGAQVLRGGAYKPRTSPYSFQGLGVSGLELLARAREVSGLPVVTEVMEPGLVPVVAEYADMLQIGSRNMQNYPLLRAAGRTRRPVLLKRGFAATIEEWLLAAEYILAEGNGQVVLCERGVRGFDPATRNQLDLTCVPLLDTLTHLPVVVDPSHGTGRANLVEPMALAALAAGADGLIIEMHPRPSEALSDREQTITPETLRRITQRGRLLRAALAAPLPAEAREPERELAHTR